MRICFTKMGAYWIAVGLATSSIAMSAASPAEARRVTREQQAEPSDGARTPRWQTGGEQWMPERSFSPRAERASRRQAKRAQAKRTHVARERGRSSGHAPAAAEWDAPYQPGYEQRFVADPPASRPSAATQRPAGRRMMAQQASRQTASVSPSASGGFGGGGVVAEARRWIGTNPTNRSSLWCATFMNFVLQRTGHGGTGSNFAKSFASFGQRVSGPQVGAIAVMSRKGGGHVGLVSGIDAAGNPVIISGNSRGRRVAETVYPRGRVYAYVMP